MQRWIRQQVTVLKREEGVRQDANTAAAAEKKAAYLRKLGLADKVKAATAIAPWDIGHVAPGDVFQGFFEHPDINGGDRMDISFEVTSDSEGSWSSERAGFDADVTIRQDFPLTFEQGPERDLDLASYIFHKFNMKWRDFEGPYPTTDELEYLQLPGMQLYFKFVAEVDGFPDEGTFRESCADPDKGMTKAEFLDFIKSDDPEYIEKTFMNIFTGRRIKIEDGELTLDGDFQKEALNHIFGYVSFEGRPGGTFELVLKK